ncbi:MAG TPA: hypothetical protein VM577_19500, partial [Anaerovoracaceae bacterium]|nr:hypothetical protein [Anaerovoracaceae bacterium]
DRLYQNVEERAAFLEAINPYWSAAESRNFFGTYIQYVIEGANALSSGDYTKDIEIYDRLTAHTNKMGDVFAQGLYDYITSGPQNTGNLPPQEGQQCITYDQMNAIYNIRMFWFELATWTINYMFSRYTGIGDPQEVFARLKKVPADYPNILTQVFGEQIAADSLQTINTYFDLIDALITARMEGNIDEMNRITQLLYQNADKQAALVSSANPFWDQEEWRSRLYNNIRSTIEESTSVLSGDYARTIDIFSRILDQSESTGNYFAQGLFNYINYSQQKQQ